MIDPRNITKLVYDIIKAMGIKEKAAYEMLIKGAFLYQSNLSAIFDYRDFYNPLHSFLMLTDEDCRRLHNKIKYNRTLTGKVFDITGIDLTELDDEYFIREMDYNIAFMICMSICFFSVLNEDIPEPNPEHMANFFVRNFLKEDNLEAEKQFLDGYRRVFLSN